MKKIGYILFGISWLVLSGCVGDSVQAQDAYSPGYTVYTIGYDGYGEHHDGYGPALWGDRHHAYTGHDRGYQNSYPYSGR
ncbi:MAG: hypothetical protein Q8R83_10065 [Legionellaceae bacterium]|nr:hypothetical protein [Legionellaceae bacterium]